jgi:hypothetical protein
VSGLLRTGITSANSNYTAKRIMDTWCAEMIGREGGNRQVRRPNAEQRCKLTLDLIRSLPEMDSTFQAFTSKYNPQAKALN